MARVFHPLPNCTVVLVRYTLDNEPVENVLTYWWPTPNRPTATQLAAMCQDIYGTIGSKIMSMMVVGSSLREVTAYNADIQHGETASYAPTPPIGGLRVSPKLASQVGYSIEKASSRRGYGEHGAIRLSGFDNQEVNQNLIQPPLFTLIANLLTSLIAPRIGSTLAPAIPHILHASFSVVTRWIATRNVVGSLDTRTPPRA
jgi:hypothetical protein